MDQRGLAKQICLKSKSGEFHESLELLKEAKLVNESALNVLIAISHGCYHHGDECDVEAMEKLLTKVISCIDVLKKNNVVTYLQSIFHITKLLCDKKRFGDLLKLKPVIIPKFFESFNLSDTQQWLHVYNMLIKQISYSVGCLAQEKDTNYNKYIFDISKLLFEAQNKLNNPGELLVLAQKCFNHMYYLGMSNDQLLTLYMILLEALPENEYIESNQVLLTSLFSSVLTIIIQSRNYQFTTMFLENIEIKVKSHFKQNDYHNCHSMFKVVLELLPTIKDNTGANIEKARTILQTFRINNEKLFFNVVQFLEEPLLQLQQCLRNEDLNIWCQLSENVVINILNFLLDDVLCYTVLSPKKCSCGCSTSKNYCGILKVGCQMSALLKYYVEQTSDLSTDFFSLLTKWLYFFYGIVKKMKDEKCQRWSSFYSELAGHTYNISVVLYRAENVAHKGIDVCFLKNSLELEGLEPKLRPIKTNTFTFSALCELEFKNENWMGSMELAALHCLLYINNSNMVFQNWWIKSKMKVKEDPGFQQQTLLSVLCKQSKQLSYLYDIDSLLTNEKKIELLTFELSRYKAVWRSKISMMAAFEQLSELADIPTISEVILEVYGDGDIQIHNDMSPIFSVVMHKIKKYLLEKRSDNNVQLAVAILYYYQFKSSFRETADKNLQEMEKTMQVLESAKNKEDIETVPKDANDECDIVSAYSNLRLNKFMEILKSLNTCEDIISYLLKETFTPTILSNISNLLLKIGFEYRLHCISIKSLHAFEMCMKIAENACDYKAQLFALSYMIEGADVNKNSVKHLINKGDELLAILERDNDDGQHNKTIATYHTCKSKAFLYEDLKQSYDYWQIANAICTATEDKDKFRLMRSELYVILYKLTKNCHFIPGEHQSEPMTSKLHCAYDIVIDIMQKNVLSSQELCIIFDIVYEVAKTYHLMRLPRDLRAYCKYSVLLTQKIVLPIRCVSFLLLLAHSDLATSKLDHCNVKLNGIDDIFCLTPSRPMMVPTGKSESEKKLVEDIERCTDLIQELVLDLPKYSRQFSPASPKLTVESFKFPEFVNHKKSCDCFMCLSLDFQKLLLEKYLLNSLMYMYEKEEKIADDYALGTLALYKTLGRNYENYRLKATKIVPESMLWNFEDIFLETYANILYHHSLHLCRKSMKTEALKINTKLIQVLKPKKMKFVYIYHDALLQRLSYIVSIRDTISDEKVMNLTPKENISVAITPASKKTTISLSVNGKICPFSPPTRRKGKKCKLFTESVSDLNDDSNKRTSQKNNEGTFSVPKLKNRTKLAAAPSTPFFGDFPKIQIFTDDETVTPVVKTYSRKRSVRKDISETSSASDSQPLSVASGSTITKIRGQLLTQKIKEASTQEAKKPSSRLQRHVVGGLLNDKVLVPKTKIIQESNNTSDSSVISLSPEHAEAKLKTEVMMEKLKLSAKKQIKQGQSKRPGVGPKNLLTELQAAPGNERSTGTIRRSTRNNRVL